MAQCRHTDAEHLADRCGQHLTALAKIAREEDHEQDLGELTRLDLQPCDPNPEARTIDLRTQQNRHQQEPDGDGTTRIAQRFESANIAEGNNHTDEEHQTKHDPEALVTRKRGIDAVDLDQPERRQDSSDREDVGIGVWQRDANDEVGDQVGAGKEGGGD